MTTHSVGDNCPGGHQAQPKTLPELIKAVRMALEAKTVECPTLVWHASKEAVERASGCPGMCGGTGRVPNPAFAPPLALVRERCDAAYTYHLAYPSAAGQCPRCGGTGYVTRTAYLAALWRGCR